MNRPHAMSNSATRKNSFRRALAELGAGVICNSQSQIASNAFIAKEAFTHEQWNYLAMRSAEYGLSPDWLLSQFKPSIQQDPDLLIDLLDKAGKYPGVQFEHIISQSTVPHLAHNPENIILGPSDGFNQSLGAKAMTAEQIHERTQDFSDYQNHAAASHHGTFGFEDSWAAWDAIRGVFVGVFAYKYVKDKEIWKKTIRLGQRIIKDMPNVNDHKTRMSMLDQVANHVNNCVGDADCHTAFLMVLLITKVPWAAKLLALKGLATLARMTAGYALQFARKLEAHPEWGFAGKILSGIIQPLDTVVNLFSMLLDTAWEALESAVKFVADKTAQLYRATTTFIKGVWNGLNNLFNWKTMLSAAA